MSRKHIPLARHSGESRNPASFALADKAGPAAFAGVTDMEEWVRVNPQFLTPSHTSA